MGVAACLLLEYGVSAAAVAVGWSQYVNKLLDNFLGHHLPQALSAAPWGETSPGIINLPAVVLVGLCAVLLIRGASESAKVNTIMVLIKLGVLVMFSVIAFTAFDTDRFAEFAPFGVAGIGAAAGTISSSPTSAWMRCPPPAMKSRIPEDHAPGDHRRAGDRDDRLRRGHRGRTRRAALAGVRGSGGRPGHHPRQGHLSPVLGHGLSSRRSHLDLLGHPRGPVRPDPNPVRHGPGRSAALAVREGQPAHPDPGEHTIIVAVVVSILAGFVPLGYLADMVSIGTLVAFSVVSVGVVLLRVREPDLPRGFRVPLYPVTPVLSVLACGYILFSLRWYTWLAFSGWVFVVLVFYFIWGRHRSALNNVGDGVITDDGEPVALGDSRPDAMRISTGIDR